MFADLLPIALAAALTPTAILAVLLFLLSARPLAGGIAFLGGWIAGLMISAGVLYRLGTDPVAQQVVRQPFFRPGILLLAGLGLLAVAGLALRGRSVPLREPAWLKRVDSLTPAHAAGLATALAGLSPKLLVLTAAAVATVILAGTGQASLVAGLGFYVLVASVPIAPPVLLLLTEGDRARLRIVHWKDWVTKNQGRILAWSSLLLGVLLVARALALAFGGPGAI